MIENKSKVVEYHARKISPENCGPTSRKGSTPLKSKSVWKNTGSTSFRNKEDLPGQAFPEARFSSLIVWILIGARSSPEYWGEWIDAWAITVIVFLNAILGFIQEYQAERSLDALKLSSPRSKVIRDGAPQIVDSNFLVPGDLVLLEAGDRIPADGRVTYSVQLSAQEAALTWESVSVRKITGSADGPDLPFGGQKEYGVHGDGGGERKRPDGCHTDRP